MKQIFSLFIIFFLLNYALYGEELKLIRTNGTLEVFLVDTPPKLDGVLNDKCWEISDRVSNFVKTDGTLPTQQTVAYVCRDKKNLYIAFECKEEKMGNIVANYKQEGDAVYLDDCVEIFIDTKHNHETYYHFMANNIGVKSADRKIKDEWGDISTDTETKLNWEVATQKYNDKWTIEICIPFSTLDKEPVEEDIWGINLNRERKPEPSENTCFCCTFGWFHIPQRFGHITFTGRKVYLSDLKLRSISDKEEKATVNIKVNSAIDKREINKTVSFTLSPKQEQNINVVDILRQENITKGTLVLSLLGLKKEILIEESYQFER